MADDLGELDGPQVGKLARRAEAQRQMIFSHKGARTTFTLAALDLDTTAPKLHLGSQWE